MYCAVLDKVTCTFSLSDSGKAGLQSRGREDNELFITYRACTERSFGKEEMEIGSVLAGSSIFFCNYENMFPTSGIFLLCWFT